MDPETATLITTVVGAVIAAVLQYVKGKDTNKHGDAFISMLKGAEDTMDKVASVFPQAQPAVKEYKEVIAEAEQIWNSGGFTAVDIQFIAMKAEFYKTQIDAIIAKARELKVPTP